MQVLAQRGGRSSVTGACSVEKEVTGIVVLVGVAYDILRMVVEAYQSGVTRLGPSGPAEIREAS
jgi:hypothetical protein